MCTYAQVVLAELDCLLSLAACARDLELARPTTLRRHSPLPRRPSLSGLVAQLTETSYSLKLGTR